MEKLGQGVGREALPETDRGQFMVEYPLESSDAQNV